MFKMDGRSWNVLVPEGGLRRSFQVLDGDNAGRVLSGLMHRDIIGTFINYEMDIETKRLDFSEYDDFYEAISDPSKDSHVMEFPYGQSVLTFDAYITAGRDELRTMSIGNHWEGLSVQFIAMKPQRRR